MDNVLSLRTIWLAALAAVLTACTTTPKPKEPPTPSYVITAPDATPLGRQVAALRPRSVARGQSGLFLLGQGVEAFSARVGLAQRATRTLDVQYYAVFNDESGTLLLGELIEAARRGVRVRLLIDDLHGSGQGLDLSLLAAVPGIEVRVFNPVRWTRLCASSIGRDDRRWRAAESPYA